MINKILSIFIPLFMLVNSLPASGTDEDGNAGASGEIIGKYLEATQSHGDAANATSVEVNIRAAVPRLQENGTLHALRVISRVGRVSYRVLGFQGSNTVKSQVIARYLQAEQQGQSDPRLAITPTNYKFRLRGPKRTDAGNDVYVFALTPRKAGMGTFKGEMWLDSRTYLPVYEKGRLVKNPSIFFKKVDFERDFAIQDGQALPQHMNSVISTRVVGKVQLDVSYSNYAQVPDSDSSASISPKAFSAN